VGYPYKGTIFYVANIRSNLTNIETPRDDVLKSLTTEKHRDIIKAIDIYENEASHKKFLESLCKSTFVNLTWWKKFTQVCIIGGVVGGVCEWYLIQS
jgi:hypothetical protein